MKKNKNSSNENYGILKQFVQDVKDFTSQYGSPGSVSYTAHNLIGKPRIFPKYGDYPPAFIMRTYGKWWEESPSGTKELKCNHITAIRSKDYIDVTFEIKVYPISVEIYETYNPGSVVRIWAYDGVSKWFKLWEDFPNDIISPVARIFSPPIKKSPFPTNYLRVEFNHEKLKYHTELDAILLSGTINSSLTSISTENFTLSNLELTEKIKKLNLHTFNTDTEDNFCDKINPFDNLPDELLLLIMKYLDLISLCKCAQVSKRFRIAAIDPYFYSDLNLKAYWWLIKGITLPSLVNRCDYLQALDLSWCNGQDFHDHFIEFIKNCGVKLKILRLNNCKFITNLCISTVSEVCVDLTELSVHNCRNVQKGWSYLKSLTQLTRLDMYHCCVTVAELITILPCFNKLQHLGLGSIKFDDSLDVVMELLPKHCPNIISLDLWKAHLLPSDGLDSISNLNNLQELDLGWSCEIDISIDGLRKIPLGCPKLKKLILTAYRGLTEYELLLIANKCQYLEQLDLLGSRGITADICTRLLMQCKCLKLIDINYCDQIKEEHVNLWREMFPNVTIQFNKFSQDEYLY